MKRLDQISEMRQRCARLLSPEFVATAVAPLIGEEAAAECSIVREHGSRLTIRYRFPSGTVVFAKAYSNRAGRRLFATMCTLWQAGFDDSRLFQVPEPLGFLEEHNLALMRGARGIRLSSRQFVEGSPKTAAPQVRAAARWLAALHSTRLSSLDLEGRLSRLKILEESDLLVEAAAARPEHSTALLELLGYVKKLSRASRAEAPLTPTHGQYIPSTLFVDSRAITAVDLDTVLLSDPAKDVAMFLSRVKHRRLFQGCGEPGQAAWLAREFLGEYTRLAGQNLVNLSYYLGLYCLRECAKLLAAKDADRASRERAVRLCRMELRACLGEKAPGQVRSGRDAFDGDGDSRPTVRPGLRLRASLYPFRRGLRCAKVVTTMWESGFGRDSAYRVPELAAFRPDSKVLLLHGTKGAPLSAALETGNLADAVRGSRNAARWLAELHRSPIRVGSPEREWDSLRVFRVPARLIHAAARFPELATSLLEILNQLKDVVERLGPSPRCVQTHGRYRPKRVFIADEITMSTDLDRSLPADPAKDVAEFVTDLRSAAHDGCYDRQAAERAEEAFLEEYFSLAPDVRSRVACYSACYLTQRLLKSLKAGGTGPRWSERLESYREAIGELCAQP